MPISAFLMILDVAPILPRGCLVGKGERASREPSGGGATSARRRDDKPATPGSHLAIQASAVLQPLGEQGVASLQLTEEMDMKRGGEWGAWILAAALLLPSSACAYGLGGAKDTTRAQDAEGAVQLNITNHNKGPMVVYAVGSGTSYLMGTVYPGLASHFVVRPGMVSNGPVEFLARPRNGGRPFRSGVLWLHPGAIVDFDVWDYDLTSPASARS
jgi:hypothetical protein